MHEAGLECQINDRAGEGVGGNTLYSNTLPRPTNMAGDVVQVSYRFKKRYRYKKNTGIGTLKIIGDSATNHNIDAGMASFFRPQFCKS
jgi:hypothetical protein